MQLRYLMIELMETIDFKNKMLLTLEPEREYWQYLQKNAEHQKIVGIDYDEWSITNAYENMEANDCQKIILIQQSNLSGIDVADIVLANINLNTLKMKRLQSLQLLKNDSFLLVSGFLVGDEREMKNIFEEKGFVKIKSNQLGDWVAILFEKY